MVYLHTVPLSLILAAIQSTHDRRFIVVNRTLNFCNLIELKPTSAEQSIDVAEVNIKGTLRPEVRIIKFPN